jgi:diguanylate cyclase (GGDEF)-like protein
MIDTLHTYLDAIRQQAGAVSGSLYIPAPDGSGANALLCHLGTAPPVPELQDEAAAAAFAQQRLKAMDGAPETLVEILNSTAKNARLLGISIADLLQHLETRQRLTKQTERRRQEQIYSAAQGAWLWLGLRWPARNKLSLEPGRYLLDQPSNSPQATNALLQQLALSAPMAWAFHWCTAWHQDSLSRMPGRTEFQSSLNQLFRQCIEQSRPMGLLLINPDDFATVNQRLGRKRGDGVLAEVAERLSATLRHTDMAFRYGGAVFAILLPEAKDEAAKAVADKLRHALSKTAYAQRAVRLAFSMGMALYDPEQPGRMATDASELLFWADTAINQAKLAGGGRTVIWDPSGDAMVVGNLDRLSGIFTADTEKDYRNMLLLWETVAFIAAHLEGDVIAREFISRIGDLFKPFRAALLTDSGAETRLLAEFSADAKSAWTRTAKAAKRPTLPETHQQLFERVKQSRQVDRLRLEVKVEGILKQHTAYAIPMLAAGSYQGCLYIEMQESQARLDSSDLVFLSALANQLANALSHAYLAARWKQEKEQESSQLKQEVRGLREALQQSKMVFCSAQMHNVMENLLKVAPTDATVLVTGESGTGKEMLAKALHEMSLRKDKPFVTVDCGAISPTLLEAELFGRAKGAYTGADSASAGRILQADGGTLFLDEVGELPLDVQVKLLRFVQEKEIMPVGANQSRRVDVRIVAATNRNLAAEVALGRFRQDLYYRLQVFVVDALPLRTRPDDVLPLARYFLEKFSVQYQKGPLHLSPEAEAALLAYDWPGNVRELQNQILKAVVMCTREGVEVHDLQLPKPSGEASQAEPASFRLPNASSPAPDFASPSAQRGAQAAAPVKPEDWSEDPWQNLRRELQGQVQRVMALGPARLEPLGRWLGEDLILLADKVCQGVARRASVQLGMAETTFRRQLQKARQDEQAGLLTRSPEWNRIGPILDQLVNSLNGSSEDNLSERIRASLLQEVITCLPHEDKTAAALMGVTLPTYRRWKETASA